MGESKYVKTESIKIYPKIFIAPTIAIFDYKNNFAFLFSTDTYLQQINDTKQYGSIPIYDIKMPQPGMYKQ